MTARYVSRSGASASNGVRRHRVSSSKHHAGPRTIVATRPRYGKRDPRCLRRGGEIEREGRALSRRAAHNDPALMTLHDAVDDGEAEAGATTGVLGREERLEDALERRLVHAGPAVLDEDAGVGAGQQVRRAV